jgi:hypothetical protein
MTELYALGCTICSKKIEVSSVTCGKAKPGPAKPQEIVDFLHKHNACTVDFNLIFGCSTTHLSLVNYELE